MDIQVSNSIVGILRLRSFGK